MEPGTAVTKDLTIGQVLRAYPQTLVVFAAHGMGCQGCMGAADESLESGARLHGVAVDRLLADLNRAVGAPAPS